MVSPSTPHASPPRIRTVITPDKHLAYAVGFLALDLPDDARAELEGLPAQFLAQPRVLLLRLEVAMASNAWTDVEAIAPEAVAADNTQERPWVAWAYALRELQRIPEAQEILLTGRRLITNPGPLVDYNLACYACLLGEMEDAQEMLASALSRDSDLHVTALEDPDLAPLFLPP